MRYSENENTVLVGQFLPEQSVTIKILDLDNDSIINVSSDICVESNSIPGIYLWNTSKLDPSGFNGFKNLLYEMTSDSGKKYYGKFLYGGYVDDELNLTLQHDPESYNAIMHLLKRMNLRM